MTPPPECTGLRPTKRNVDVESVERDVRIELAPRACGVEAAGHARIRFHLAYDCDREAIGAKDHRERGDVDDVLRRPTAVRSESTRRSRGRASFTETGVATATLPLTATSFARAVRGRRQVDFRPRSRQRLEPGRREGRRRRQIQVTTQRRALLVIVAFAGQLDPAGAAAESGRAQRSDRRRRGRAARSRFRRARPWWSSCRAGPSRSATAPPRTAWLPQ